MTAHDRSFADRAPDMGTQQIADLLTAKANLWRITDLSDLMQSAVEAAVATSGFETGAIYLLDRNVLYLGATTPPLPEDFPNALRFANAIDHPHIMHALDTESPLMVDDLSTETLSPAEREVVEVRDLRSILYVPLFASDRPTGVFMLGATGETRRAGERELIIAQTLAHSVATAFEEADLFDTLMTNARDRGGNIEQRLTELARVAATRHGSEVSELADELQHRLQHRLVLLEICDELLTQGPLIGTRTEDGRPSCSEDLLNALDESRAFAHAAGLEFGLKAALEFLAERVGIGPAPNAIRLDDRTQMTDPDTTLLLYRSAKEILEQTARHHFGKAHSLELVVADDERVVMRLTADQRLCRGSDDAEGDSGPLAGLRDRLRRAAGDLALARKDGLCEVRVELPYFSRAS